MMVHRNNFLKALGAAGALAVLGACVSDASAPPGEISRTPTRAIVEVASAEDAWFGPFGDAAPTKGGQGGRIIKVTTLSKDGPGSLREALLADGPRIIVFEVGGVIDLEGEEVVIPNPDVTIAGQTAPSPGITLIKGGLSITGHDVIIQHLRIRPGDLGEGFMSGRDIDAITTIAAYNVIVDHCSLSWATDENLSASGPRFTGDGPDDWRMGTSHNIAYTNNLIAEGLSHATHAKGEHSKGSLIHDNVSGILIYRNIYAHNYERSPLFKGGVHGSIVNNFIFDPGQRAVHYNLQGLEWGRVPAETGKMNLIGNVMRAGLSTLDGLPLLTLGGDGDLDLYAQDNIAVDRWGEPLPAIGRYTTGKAKLVPMAEPFALPPGLPVLEASALENYVLRNAGARPWDRDMHDVRILADVAEGRGRIIDSQQEVGGYPVETPSQQTFNPGDWNLETMEPNSRAVLDASSKARGT